MECRICRSTNTAALGSCEFLEGYNWTVSACHDCGCRFTQHDNSVYELLHQSGAISYYSDYRKLADASRELFQRRDRDGLKTFLRQTPKYRFVIEQVEHQPADARILEIGCSRGYLTSYFILAGRKILGVDVSTEAVESARKSFGDHFTVAGSQAIADGAPYDVVYHVGMIGCVVDPVRLTRELLHWLKPGGKLLFNAPNLDSCYLRDQLWLDSAPPPDLVTLFPPGFWRRHFADVADVHEAIETLGPEASLVIGLRRVCGKSWRKPQPLRLRANAPDATPPAPSADGRAWNLFERCVRKAGRVTGLARLAPSQPAEFGLFVTMTKKG